MLKKHTDARAESGFRTGERPLKTGDDLGSLQDVEPGHSVLRQQIAWSICAVFSDNKHYSAETKICIASGR